VLALAVSVAWAIWDRSQNRLTVENRSGQAIDIFRVSVGGDTVVVRELATGDETTAAFHVGRSKAHFVVDGRLADGTPIAGEFGYVSGGLGGQRARFIVRPGGRIEFSESVSESAY
jgi:hypothetical protein